MLGLAKGTVHTHRMAAGGTEDILSNWYHLGCSLSTLVSSSFELVPSSFRAIFLATCDTQYHQLTTLSKSNVPLGTLALETTSDNKKGGGEALTHPHYFSEVVFAVVMSSSGRRFASIFAFVCVVFDNIFSGGRLTSGCLLASSFCVCLVVFVFKNPVVG